MEWNIFEEWMDVVFYQQMKELIFRVSNKSEKYTLRRENERYELFPGEPARTADQDYGLHYPGEVLERLGEHREITKKQIRALGLALAKTKNLQEDSMFIGNQLPAFLKRMDGTAGKNDPFIMGIRYLLDEKTKKQSYENFISYPFTEAAEILFALSVLPEDDGLWYHVRGKLDAALGKGRQISVYENAGVYVWLAGNFQFRMQGYRKKDMDTLKYLMRLPFGSASANGGMVQKKLLESGYSREEIFFLNYKVIQEVRLADRIKISSITGEKLAIEVCRSFLDAEEEFPEQAYELCSQICASHNSFHIKVNGNDGMADALKELVEVKNVKAFRVLYPYRNKAKSWKRLNLTDERWDIVYAWLPQEEYDDCVTGTLEAEWDTGKLKACLDHYRGLTGKDYIQRFWEEKIYDSREVFAHLAECGVLPVVRLTEQFLKEYREEAETAEEKWEIFLWYLQKYATGIQSQEAYAILELFVRESGINNLGKLFSVTELLESCFTEDYSRSFYYRRRKKLELFRPFLEMDEHRKLFSWIDEYIFR